MSGLLSSLAFGAPWMLWALLPLPAIWLILRVIPPAPVLRRFPGVVLLLGLSDRETAAARTPFWLLLIRVLALAAAIVGFAGPVLNPADRGPASGPLLVLVDATWADAPGWQDRRQFIVERLEAAERDGRPAALVALSDAGKPVIDFTLASDLRDRARALEPNPWEADAARLAAVRAALPDEEFETLWLTDGLERAGQGDLARALAGHGAVTVVDPGTAVLALTPPVIEAGGIVAGVLRPRGGPGSQTLLSVIGLDPSGTERELAQRQVTFAAGATEAEARFDLPPELRNRITRIQIADASSAGAVVLGRRCAEATQGGAGRRRRRARGAGTLVARPLSAPGAEAECRSDRGCAGRTAASCARSGDPCRCRAPAADPMPTRWPDGSKREACLSALQARAWRPRSDPKARAIRSCR